MSGPRQSVLWVGGWGIPEQWGLDTVRAHFPDADHQWRIPSANALESLDAYDHVVGYSLGASLLLRANAGSSAVLLAPFVDFKSESRQGGRISSTQLRYVRRSMAADPVAALNDFYVRAGLAIQTTGLPYAREVLDWGLDQLLADVPRHDAHRSCAIVGVDDPLLDPSAILPHFAEVEAIQDAKHDLAGLLPELSIKI